MHKKIVIKCKMNKGTQLYAQEKGLYRSESHWVYKPLAFHLCIVDLHHLVTCRQVGEL